MHFSQGDGEVSFCGAIEMSGFIELRCTVTNTNPNPNPDPNSNPNPNPNPNPNQARPTCY